MNYTAIVLGESLVTNSFMKWIGWKFLPFKRYKKTSRVVARSGHLIAIGRNRLEASIRLEQKTNGPVRNK